MVTQSKITTLIFSVLASLLVWSGCQQIDSIFSTSMKPSVIDMLGPTSFLARYDTSNVVGLVQLETYLRSGNANFIDGNGNPMNISRLIFNKNPFNQFSTGYYVNDSAKMPIYTNDTTPNYVSVVGDDSSFGSGFDSLTYGISPRIINIVNGQTVSRDSAIPIAWTGASGDFVYISVLLDSSESGDTIGKGIAVGGYFNNTGSASVQVVPVQLKLGTATITLTKYEPKFMTLTSGKRVCVVCETSDEITVHIVN